MPHYRALLMSEAVAAQPGPARHGQGIMMRTWPRWPPAATHTSMPRNIYTINYLELSAESPQLL